MKKEKQTMRLTDITLTWIVVIASLGRLSVPAEAQAAVGKDDQPVIEIGLGVFKSIDKATTSFSQSWHSTVPSQTTLKRFDVSLQVTLKDGSLQTVSGTVAGDQRKIAFVLRKAVNQIRSYRLKVATVFMSPKSSTEQIVIREMQDETLPICNTHCGRVPLERKSTSW
jgi:hypothetical protein